MPTVSLSRSKIFILADDDPGVDESPTVTIRERYPDTAATTSMVREVWGCAREAQRATEEM
jgi:hypothetical protein